MLPPSAASCHSSHAKVVALDEGTTPCSAKFWDGFTLVGLLRLWRETMGGGVALQSVHAESVAFAEYVPLAHAVHAFAPVDEPVFVIDPAVHSEQCVRPAMLEYLPASHLMHAPSKLDPPATVPYRPSVQSMHADAAVEPLAVTYLPAAHAMQSDAALEPVAATYVPTAHAMQSEA